jgi:YCII-related domain
MADTPEAQAQAMQAWGAWFGTLGAAVTDMGNPFSNSATVGPNGTADGGASQVGGYSIVEAGSLSEATAKTAGCPVLQNGGAVEVYEAVIM